MLGVATGTDPDGAGDVLTCEPAMASPFPGDVPDEVGGGASASRPVLGGPDPGSAGGGLVVVELDAAVELETVSVIGVMALSVGSVVSDGVVVVVWCEHCPASSSRTEQ